MANDARHNSIEIFAVKPGQRALLTGRTGTGKSTLARHMLRNMTQLVIIVDPKGDFDYPNSIIIRDPRDLSAFRRSREKNLVYRPDPEFWDMQNWDNFFKWAYMFGNCVLYLDEVFAVMVNNQSPPWLKAILTRGRSLLITCIACTQRPFSIPVSLLSECEHRYMFGLSLLDDKKRMAELMPGNTIVNGKEVPTVLLPLSGRHNFYYYDVYADEPTKEYRLVIAGKRG